MPDGEGGWAVKKEGDSRKLRVFSKKSEAMSYARSKAGAYGISHLIIHRVDGRIQDVVSYGRKLKTAAAAAKKKASPKKKKGGSKGGTSDTGPMFKP